MISFDRILIENVERVFWYTPGTNDLLAIFDQPKNYTLENTVDITNIPGKKQVTLGSLERNKATTFTFSDAYVMASAISGQTGGEIISASTDNKIKVPWYETIQITSSTESETVQVPNTDPETQEETPNIEKTSYTVSLEYVPVGVQGSEVEQIYKANADGSQGEKFLSTAESTVGETTFIVKATEQTLKLPAGAFEVGDTVIVAYEREIDTGMKITNSAENTSSTVRCVVDVLGADVCNQNEKYHILFEIPMGKVDGNMTLEVGDEGTSPEIKINAITNICSPDKELCNFYLLK